MTEPRPKFTKEVAESAAQEIARHLIEAGFVDGDVESYATDIAKYGEPYKDGYELARDLERYCYWDCSLQIAEVLDGFSTEADAILRKQEKEWAERCKPEPPLPVGTRIKMRDGKTGLIDGLYEYQPARYTVKEDGDPDADSKSQRRRIIRFEDAVAA